DLIHRALLGRLVRAPAQQARAVAKTPAAEVIEGDFDHQLGGERLPFAGALGRPAARPARRVAGEAGRLDQALELLRQRVAFTRADAGRKSDVMQQSVVVIEPEQQRAHGLAVRAVAEAADHAIGAAIVLDLLYGGALARPVCAVALFGDDAV